MPAYAIHGPEAAASCVASTATGELGRGAVVVAVRAFPQPGEAGFTLEMLVVDAEQRSGADSRASRQ